MGTIDDGIGRRGDVSAEETQAEVLVRAQRLYAGLARRLEAELDTLQFGDFEELDEKAYKKVDILIRDNQRTMTLVLEQQAKLADMIGLRRAGDLDLDAARREVETRLARIAA
ncbi:MAG: hypothetical protein AAF713_05585 [Pseudomonadota bacterium]